MRRSVLSQRYHSFKHSLNICSIKTRILFLIRKESLFSLLPVEIILYIFGFLNINDLCSAIRVSRRWKQIGCDGFLWKLQCAKYWENFINFPKVSFDKRPDEHWKDFFTKKYAQNKSWRSANFSQTTLTGHVGTVWTLAFDDTKLVTGSFDKTIKIWDRDTFKCIKTLRGHAYPIQCLQFRGNLLVTGSLDNSIRLWDIESGESMGSITDRAHNFDVFCLQFEGDRLVSGSSDSSIKVWDMKTSSCLHSLKHSSCVTCLQFEGGRLMTGSADKTVKVWDLRSCSNRPVSTLSGHLESVRCLQFVDNALVSGSNDGTLKVWDLRCANSCVSTLRGHAGGVRCLQFAGAVLVSGSADRTIRLWDLRSPPPSTPLSPPSNPPSSSTTLLRHATSVACLMWHDGLLVCGFSDAKVKVCAF